MTSRNLHDLCHPERWDNRVVHYVPYVGAGYFGGLIDGVRLLLVGESHYEKANTPDDESRQCTLTNFGGYADPSVDLAGDRIFFKRVGELPTMRTNPDREKLANAWRRIAFTNFLQKSVGQEPSRRPTADNWSTGEPALQEIIRTLQPDAVLFLSASVWNRVLYGMPYPAADIPAMRQPRRLWLLPHGAGQALSTWVYHPSWNLETQSSRLAVLAELLRLAKKLKQGK